MSIFNKGKKIYNIHKISSVPAKSQKTGDGVKILIDNQLYKDQVSCHKPSSVASAQFIISSPPHNLSHE